MLPIFYTCPNPLLSTPTPKTNLSELGKKKLYRDGDIPTLSISLSAPCGLLSKN